MLLGIPFRSLSCCYADSKFKFGVQFADVTINKNMYASI